MREAILAKTDRTILITGATGTGKSRKAKQLHELSGRNKFLHVNICNFSKSLIESELYGHCKGSFTGASSNKPGFLEAIGEGTLFLDEIGDLELESQSKLLMLLEEGAYFPVGSTQSKKFRGRLLFATHKNLSDMVEKGEFRRDLWHRIRAFEIKLCALSEKDDLEDLIEREFIQAKASAGKSSLILDDYLLKYLVQYDWPGNYRELKNTMDYICLFSDSIATLNKLPDYMNTGNDAAIVAVGSYRAQVDKFEREYLTKMLAQRDYRINKTAREIEISKVTLLSKMKKYGIKNKNKNLGKAV